MCTINSAKGGGVQIKIRQRPINRQLLCTFLQPRINSEPHYDKWVKNKSQIRSLNLYRLQKPLIIIKYGALDLSRL